MPSREYTATQVLWFLKEKGSDPNYPFGFTVHYLMSYVSGIRSQTWGRLSEIIDNLEKRGFVEKTYDGASKQWHFKITPKGVETAPKWKEALDELRNTLT